MRRTRPHIDKLPVHRADNAKKSPNNADPTDTTNWDSFTATANQLDTDNYVNGAVRTLEQRCAPSGSKQHTKPHDDEPH
jgi:hypothetical protein